MVSARRPCERRTPLTWASKVDSIALSPTTERRDVVARAGAETRRSSASRRIVGASRSTTPRFRRGRVLPANAEPASWSSRVLGIGVAPPCVTAAALDASAAKATIERTVQTPRATRVTSAQQFVSYPPKGGSRAPPLTALAGADAQVERHDRDGPASVCTAGRSDAIRAESELAPRAREHVRAVRRALHPLPDDLDGGRTGPVPGDVLADLPAVEAA